ncbi:hypothetical protein BO94DRAFT_602226 [Aspergillus sclerotioniger CBS 115572]|uniref:Uncharacterized protein n=1 Tax=Aspergillus sclerotioniger CBS 115572 TaxID=1450535 RepID=A0A317W758_9EURO|nr:hypothetical protein BO94DRAFT_602226 [Aspergillus sclerotioniger CBS 115572]PWY80848.1 hypothetical protein BO94DRAFT_602226 [Aspergillus sclerotioniger CBS 115572]
MLTPLYPPQDLWPGGIPTQIHLDNGPGLDYEEMAEASKGWCLFVQVSTPNCPCSSRNIQFWLRIVQSYYSRAPLPPSALHYPPSLLHRSRSRPKNFICFAPVNRDKDHAKNYTHLTKLLILLYIHENWAPSHPFSYDPSAPHPSIPAQYPDLARYPSSENFISLYYLETADFRYLSVTRTGTVFLAAIGQIYTVIDQDTLKTGRLALFSFQSNGQVKSSTRLRPWHMGAEMSTHHMLGWPLERLIDEHSYYHLGCDPLNMDLPIVDIVNSSTQRGELHVPYSREHWALELELFAPGYLELEARGLEVEYELTSLSDEMDSYNHRVPPQKGPYRPGRAA